MSTQRKRKYEHSQASRRTGAGGPSGSPPRTPGGGLPEGALPLMAALAVFLLVRGVATFSATDGMRLWGVDFARWLEGGVVVQALLWLPLVLLLPPVARMFQRGAGAEHRDGAEGSAGVASRWLLAAGLSLGAAALAWLFPVAYAFLGDGTWYAAELYRSITLPDYANSMIKPSAWLTGLLIDAAGRMLRPDDIRLPFAVAGLIGMFVAASSVFFSLRKERAAVIVAGGVLLLGGSGVLVFFGYIELYAPVYALSLAYFITAWQTLRGTVAVWLPALLLLLAVLFGGIALAWVPSLLLLLHWKVRGEGGAFPLVRAAFALMLLPLAAVLGLYVLSGTLGDSAYLVAITPYERIVDGLHTGWQRYVLGAPERWMDLLNMLWLGLGPVFPLLPVLLWLGWRDGTLRRPSVLFGMTAAAGGLVFLVFGNTFLGLARDWDVGAFALLGTLFLAFAIWTEGLRDRRGWSTLLLPGLAAAIVSHSALWVAVNTSEDASAARFESIAMMDDGLLLPMNSFTAYENLRKYHQSGGDTEAYFRVLRRQIATGYRMHIGYAEYLSSVLKLGDAVQRAGHFRWLFDSWRAAVEREGNAADQRVLPRQDAREFTVRLLLSALQTGHGDLAGEYESSFRTVFGSWPEVALLDVLRAPGTAAGDSARIAMAVSDSTRDAFLHMTAGGLYQQRGYFAEAARAYDTALEREPRLYPSWYLVAFELHRSHTGDQARARALLEACIANAPASPEAARARRLLDE
ncbi:MAG: hypothetical protein KFF77_11580 [Bacteroidetes bacterium]|nr:hypothetical protein [Bacteroidota bacterium]